jgi:hypothetical protein
MVHQAVADYSTIVHNSIAAYQRAVSLDKLTVSPSSLYVSSMNFIKSVEHVFDMNCERHKGARNVFLWLALLGREPSRSQLRSADQGLFYRSAAACISISQDAGDDIAHIFLPPPYFYISSTII